VRRVVVANRISDVYNIEVHGHHVYRITDDGILVHNNGSMQVPRGAVRSRHYSHSSVGRQLHAEAQAYRARAGFSKGRNIAVADVVVDGVRQTVRFKNDPGGMHSEQRLVSWYQVMLDRKRQVEVLGVYSDRPPCGGLSANCADTLGNFFGEFLDVWHGDL